MLLKKHAKKVTAAALAVLMTTGVVQTGTFSAFATGEQEAGLPASFDLRDRDPAGLRGQRKRGLRMSS